MPQSMRPGQVPVLVVIFALLLTSATVIVSSTIQEGFDDIATDLVRFTLTAILCWFLYRGANWARILVAVLTFIAGLFALPSGVILFLQAPMFGLLLINIGIIDIACWVTLIFVPSVRTYFAKAEIDHE